MTRSIARDCGRSEIHRSTGVLLTAKHMQYGVDGVFHKQQNWIIRPRAVHPLSQTAHSAAAERQTDRRRRTETHTETLSTQAKLSRDDNYQCTWRAGCATSTTSRVVVILRSILRDTRAASQRRPTFRGHSAKKPRLELYQQSTVKAVKHRTMDDYSVSLSNTHYSQYCALAYCSENNWTSIAQLCWATKWLGFVSRVRRVF